MTLSCPSCPIYPVKPPLPLFNWGGIVFIFYSTGVKFRRTNAAYLTGAPKKFFISFSNFMVKKQIRIENSVLAHVLPGRPLRTFLSFKIQHSSLLYLRPLFRTEKIVKEKLLKVME